MSTPRLDFNTRTITTHSHALRRNEAIIKHLNVFEYCLLSFFSSLEDFMVNQLCFQRMKKAFSHRFIPAVTLATCDTQKKESKK